ncbi:MAG: hypothetical protein WKG07_22175 [Hymenobacter sp.]
MVNRDNSPAGILPQPAFDQAVFGTWSGSLSASPMSGRCKPFYGLDKQLVTGVGFSIEGASAQLVSTIGAARVKARFIIHALVPGGPPQFLLALFAVDALDARVSSYYVPEHLWPG